MTPSKEKGTRFESLLVPELKQFYPHAERRPLAGSNDKGDFFLPGEDRFIIEAKNVTRFNLAQWIAEAHAEAINAGVPFGVVFHKRRNVGEAARQWATMEVRTFLSLVNSNR
jgi:hypothetical protein